MKSIALAASAALLALSGASANASSEPRCWYGENSPSCVASQDTNATRTGDEKANTVTGNEVREFDHERKH